MYYGKCLSFSLKILYDSRNWRFLEAAKPNTLTLKSTLIIKNGNRQRKNLIQRTVGKCQVHYSFLVIENKIGNSILFAFNLVI